MFNTLRSVWRCQDQNVVMKQGANMHSVSFINLVCSFVSFHSSLSVLMLISSFADFFQTFSCPGHQVLSGGWKQNPRGAWIRWRSEGEGEQAVPGAERKVGGWLVQFVGWQSTNSRHSSSFWRTGVRVCRVEPIGNTTVDPPEFPEPSFPLLLSLFQRPGDLWTEPFSSSALHLHFTFLGPKTSEIGWFNIKVQSQQLSSSLTLIGDQSRDLSLRRQ